jgi:type I site-specific restriction endonuclease
MPDLQLAERVAQIESNQADITKALALLAQKMESMEEKFESTINFITEKNDIVLTNLTEKLEKSSLIDEKLIARLDQMAEMFHQNEIRIQKTEDFIEKRLKIESWGKKALISMLIAGIGAVIPKIFTIIYLLLN